MRLWLDDCRPAPEGWTRVTSVDEAKIYVEQYEIDEMSLDHDLGMAPWCAECQARSDSPDDIEDPDECRCKCHREIAPTGYDFVKWLVETEYWPVEKPRVHSANPIGAKRMRDLIDDHFTSVS